MDLDNLAAQGFILDKADLREALENTTAQRFKPFSIGLWQGCPSSGRDPMVYDDFDMAIR